MFAQTRKCVHTNIQILSHKHKHNRMHTYKLSNVGLCSHTATHVLFSLGVCGLQGLSEFCENNCYQTVA